MLVRKLIIDRILFNSPCNPKFFLHLWVVCLLLLLPKINGFAQEMGSPFTRNYHATEFKAHMQNWAIVQDHRGILYFANKEGVLEYDGSNWNIIKVNRDVSSLDVAPNGRIYVGAIGDLGVLEPNATGKLEFSSFISKLDTSAKTRNFEEVWKVYATQEGIYFQTNKWLARYKNGKFKMWYPKKANGFHFSFWVRNSKLYIRESGIGLMELNENDELIVAAGGDMFADEKVYTVLPYDSQRLLIGTRNLGLFIWSPVNGDLQKFITSSDQFLIDNQIYNGIKLRNGNFVIATLTGGAVVLNASGHLEQIINKQAFLQNESVHALYNDRQNNLWMALGNGISNVEIESPWEQWNELHGLKGIVYSIMRHNKKLYLGTSQGAFYLHENRFEQIDGIKGQTWDLLSLPESKEYTSKLLIGNANGIYSVNGTKSELLFSGSHCLKLYHSKHNPSKVYAGFNNSIAMLELIGNQVIYRGTIKDIEGEVRNISEDDDGNLIINIPFRGLCVISPEKTEKFVAKEIIYIGEDRGFNTIESDVFTLNSKLFFTKNKKLYHFNENNGKFEENTMLDKYLNMGRISHLANDSIGDIWMSLVLNSSKKEAIGVLRKQKDGSYSDDLESFKRLPQMSIEEVYPEDNGIVWIGGSSGLFRYNTEIPNYYNTTFHALIRKVTVNSDSTVFNGAYYNLDETDSLPIVSLVQPKNFNISFGYDFNEITFHFAAPYYTDENQTVYSYYLENFDKTWCTWHYDNSKEYTNLPEGNYNFHVKARNIYGIESKISSYGFQIHPPWFRTKWAYLGYLLFAIVIIWSLLRVYTKRLQKEKLLLEKIVQERTAEIMLKNDELEHQKEEIIHQSDDLKVLNDEMATKNQELEIRRAEIEKKNDDIKASLNYSQRIQNALLPNIVEMKKSFQDLFVLIMPRDIVSGDFYWFGEVKKHRTEKKKYDIMRDEDVRSIQFVPDAREIQSFVAYDSENYEVPTGSQVLTKYTIIACVDCTGHGVPGALMSMIGSNIMNEIILIRGIVEPEDILAALNLGVRKVLRQDESKNKDGMDMAICVVDWHEKEVNFSGAKNPLMYVQNSEIIEIKGDKKSIGGAATVLKGEDTGDFSAHTIKIDETTSFYMMSDGFEDQFGGAENRKFMRKNLRELLHKNYQLPMEEQNTILRKTITDWMLVGGNAHQIDDILIVAFKIEAIINARDVR